MGLPGELALEAVEYSNDPFRAPWDGVYSFSLIDGPTATVPVLRYSIKARRGRLRSGMLRWKAEALAAIDGTATAGFLVAGDGAAIVESATGTWTIELYLYLKHLDLVAWEQDGYPQEIHYVGPSWEYCPKYFGTVRT